jgi:hypothetical protein
MPSKASASPQYLQGIPDAAVKRSEALPQLVLGRWQRWGKPAVIGAAPKSNGMTNHHLRYPFNRSPKRSMNPSTTARSG